MRQTAKVTVVNCESCDCSSWALMICWAEWI